MSNVPAVTQAGALLRALAERGPSTATALAKVIDAPRSTTYHLLAVLRDDGYVIHLPERKRWALGPTAFFVGQGFLRHDPREELARPALIALAEETGATAHLGVLHGTEVLYLAKESARTGRPAPTLITGVGVRLPAATTASGRALLACLPSEQVRALMSSDTAFAARTERGPTTLSALQRVLTQERRDGYSMEEGEVMAGFASVAAAAVDRRGQPIASVGLTVRATDAVNLTDLAQRVRRTTQEVQTLLG